VLLNVAGPLATITLNRPHVLNAQDAALMEALESAVDTVARMPDLRVVVVRGAGRAFSAGLDLEMRARGEPPDFFERQERTRQRLESLNAITVAAVHGPCLGGGLQLAIACDIRVCSTDARLGLPAVLEGLFPGLATVRLPRLIGLGPARRLILSGEVIEAPEALQLGLVDHVVPAETFDSELAAILETYLRVPPAAAAASKTLMQAAFEEPLSASVDRLGPLMDRCRAAPEAQAAIAAWRRRRSTHVVSKTK
jgi:enoyl-CoA hydratase/carnithine racemase